MSSTQCARGVRPRCSLRLFALAGTASLFVLLGTLHTARAQSLIVPNTLTENAATSGLATPFDSAARTYMGYLDPTQFASLTGPVTITGMQFRLAIGFNSSVTGAWPPQSLTFSSYNVQLAQGSAAVQSAREFSDSTLSFASDQLTSSVVNVRTGALTLAAGSFLQDGGGTSANSFGPLISFATPYTYTPGQTLTYLISSSGYGSTAVDQAFFASTDYAAQTVDALVSTAGMGATTPTGFSSPLFVQFQYTAAATAVPEPGTISLLLAGGVTLGAGVFRRRSRK